MKKINLFLLIFIGIPCLCFGQSIKEIASKSATDIGQGKELIRTVNNLKSGNWQDVATNFFQLALGDITGKDHSFGFKANLFALKVKADSSLLIDRNYIKQQFARNFQFDFLLKLDTSYHFNGLKAGFTWAIVNKRDSTVVQFINKYSREFYRELEKVIVPFRFSLEDGQGHFKSPKDSLVYVAFRKALTDSLGKELFSGAIFPKDFRNPILDDLYKKADSTFKAALTKVARQPLLTLSAKGNFDKGKGLLNGGSAELVYLQGIVFGQGSRIEADVRANVNTKDTTLNNNTIKRDLVNVKGGFSINLVRNNKSFFEFKPNAEYNRVLRGGVPGEKKETFYANGEFRLRITDDLWLPFIIKYDVKKGNVLGFLNVSLNMNAFKKT